VTFPVEKPPPLPPRLRRGRGLWRRPSLKGLFRGPLLGKELRASSRRPRTYLLRLGYLLALGLYAVLVWHEQVSGLGGLANQNAHIQSSRAAEAGKEIILSITIFQAIVAPVLAAMLASNVIAGELTGRTLSVLMATPLSLRRIVTEKVLASTSQVLWLLAASLPLMALVRVFGGVPWWYVFWSVALTLAISFFAASMAALYSVRCRNAWMATMHALIYMVVILGVLSVVAMMASAMILTSPIAAISPVVVLVAISREMMNPGGLLLANIMPPLSCAVTVAFSGVAIRRAATHLAVIETEPPLGEENYNTHWRDPLIAHKSLAELKKASPDRWRSRKMQAKISAADPIITGSPIIWREQRRRVMQNRGMLILTTALPIGMLLPFYVIFLLSGLYRSPSGHIAPVVIVMLTSLLLTAVLAATSISTERQGRTWAILFTAPWGPGRVLRDKLLGVLMRTRLLWAILGVHMVIFVVTWHLHWALPLLLAVVAAGASLLICGLAFYASTRARSVPAVLAATFVVLVAMWVVLPALAPTVFSLLGPRSDELHAVLQLPRSMNPVVQAIALTRGASTDGLAVSWPLLGSASRLLSPAEASMLVLGTASLNVAAGLLLLWRASRRCMKTL
jgi:ABC-type transport system involved in multi-copper enzyme maturation permease subunit